MKALILIALLLTASVMVGADVSDAENTQEKGTYVSKIDTGYGLKTVDTTKDKVEILINGVKLR